jgi:FkbM family methyltransferase
MCKNVLTSKTIFIMSICVFGHAFPIKLKNHQVDYRAISDTSPPKAEPKFQGYFGEPRTEISNITYLAPYYLPYNPIVVEIGGYEGTNTVNLSNAYSYGTIIVFEPNPRAFNELAAKAKGHANIKAYNLAVNVHNGTTKFYLDHGKSGNDLSNEQFSSILKYRNAAYNPSSAVEINVPCVVLDEWFKSNGIDHIDFLQIDVEGFELPILMASPEIIKTARVICTKTHLNSTRMNETKFADLKRFLNQMGFEMLAHWYLEGLQGEATFLRTEIFNAMYR